MQRGVDKTTERLNASQRIAKLDAGFPGSRGEVAGRERIDGRNPELVARDGHAEIIEKVLDGVRMEVGREEPGPVLEEHCRVCRTARSGRLRSSGRPNRTRHRRNDLMGGLNDVLRHELRLTADELRDELQAAGTIAELAATHGVALRRLVDVLIVDGVAFLNRQEARGRISRGQADRMLSNMKTKMAEHLSRPHPWGQDDIPALVADRRTTSGPVPDGLADASFVLSQVAASDEGESAID